MATVESEPFEVGQEIMARFGATAFGAKGTRWFDGKITKVNGDGTFDVRAFRPQSQSLVRDGIRNWGRCRACTSRRSARRPPTGDPG